MPVLPGPLPVNRAWNGCLISFEWLFLSAQTICHYHVVKRALHKTKAGKKNKKPVGAKYHFDPPPLQPFYENIYCKTRLLPHSNVSLLFLPSFLSKNEFVFLHVHLGSSRLDFCMFLSLYLSLFCFCRQPRFLLTFLALLVYLFIFLNKESF